MKLILLGPPGAGKGTQAERICERLNIPAISTGNILRSAMKERTPIGQKAEAFVTQGVLVPDEIIIDIIHERVACDDCANGYILDGVPRTIVQAKAIENAGIVFDKVVSIEIPDETIIDRMADRRVCECCGASYHLIAVPPKIPGKCDKCGGKLILRHDDQTEIVKKRLKIYHKETEPLKNFYAQRGILKSVENRVTIAETSQAILQALASV